MDKVFVDQIGRNVEVYVDDIIAKTSVFGDHCNDLKENFAQIRRRNMRLNPDKYAFGVKADKFLGFMIMKRRIEANSDKCQVIIKMRSPHAMKEVQSLARKVVPLSCFMSKVVDKLVPFFECIRLVESFEWIKDSENAFL